MQRGNPTSEACGSLSIRQGIQMSPRIHSRFKAFSVPAVSALALGLSMLSATAARAEEAAAAAADDADATEDDEGTK